MDTGDCAVCGRLWRAYAQATIRHIALVNEQRTAYTNCDFTRASQLEAEIDEVGRQRQEAGDAIHCHEVEDHKRFSAGDSSTPSRGAGEL